MPGHWTAPSRVVVVISTVLVALVLLLASAVDAAGTDPESTDHLVRSGDTLWAIAAELSPEGDDVREMVDVIRAMNDIESSLLVPGQVLEVPVVD